MAIYYVDGAVGSDTNGGLSAGAGFAFATIGKAASMATTAGDIVNIKASATYTLTTSVNFNSSGGANGIITFKGYGTSVGDGGRPVIISATASTHLFVIQANNLAFESLAFAHSGSTRGSGIYAGSALRSGIVVRDCLFDGCLRGIDGDYQGGPWTFTGLTVINCEIMNSTSDGISNGASCFLDSCAIHHNVRDGFRNSIYPGANGYANLTNCRFYSNGAANIHQSQASIDATYLLVVTNCTIHGATGDGIVDDGTTGCILVIRNNIITANGGYGIKLSRSGASRVFSGIDYNWFGTGSLANTLGARISLLFAGVHDLSGDPQYVNAAAYDFTPQNAAVQAGSP